MTFIPIASVFFAVGPTGVLPCLPFVAWHHVWQEAVSAVSQLGSWALY